MIAPEPGGAGKHGGLGALSGVTHGVTGGTEAPRSLGSDQRAPGLIPAATALRAVRDRLAGEGSECPHGLSDPAWCAICTPTSPALACPEAPGSLRNGEQPAPRVMASPIPAPSSYFVPAGPVLELIARRQETWGFSTEDMKTYLGPECAIRDARGVLSRRQAEAILRRLLAPAKGTRASAKMATHQAIAEAWQVSTTVRERIADELAGRPSGEAL